MHLRQEYVVSWGGETFNVSNRGSFHVFITLDHNIMFGMYGDELVMFEDENYTLAIV